MGFPSMIPRNGTGVHAAASGRPVAAAFGAGAHLPRPLRQGAQVSAREQGVPEQFRAAWMTSGAA